MSSEAAYRAEAWYRAAKQELLAELDVLAAILAITTQLQRPPDVPIVVREIAVVTARRPDEVLEILRRLTARGYLRGDLAALEPAGSA